MRHWKTPGEQTGDLDDEHCPGVNRYSLDGVPRLLPGTATLSIPGRGTIVTGGPLAAAFCSPGSGAVGDVTGWLVRLGLTESDAENLSRGFDDGDILIVV
jgi:hypothetical protein